MKSIFFYSLLVIILLFSLSCQKGFQYESTEVGFQKFITDFEIMGPENIRDDDLEEITKFYYIKKYNDENAMLFALKIET